MAVTHQGVFVQNFNTASCSFTNSDSANTKKTVFTFGANGSKCVAILAASTDNTSRIGQVWRTSGNTSWLLGSQTVSVTAGSDGANATASLIGLIPSLPVDNDGQVYISGGNGDTIQISFTTQVTTTKEIDCTAYGGDL